MSRRSGLGRGLDALLPPSGEAGLEERSSLRTVPLDSIEPNPRQPRRAFDEVGIEELSASIRTLGVLQPLLVRELYGDRYELIAGERRLRAAARAGLSSVPVIVATTDSTGSLERALVENLHREDLNPIEEAAGYAELMGEGGLTHESLAARLGRNRVTITNALRLLDLPLSVQGLLVEGRLTAGHGRALLGLSGSPFLERLARRAADERLSVRETEDLVRRYRDMAGVVPGAAKTGSRTRERGPEVTEAQRRLADRLQTRVRVEMGARKGRIVLDFVSLDELERLVAAIEGADPAGDQGAAQ